VHEGDDWSHVWDIEPGSRPGSFHILTTSHERSETPPGWGLAAFRSSDGIRDAQSTWVVVHKTDPHDWYFEMGSQPNTFRIRHAGDSTHHLPAGWGLSAFDSSAADGIRNPAQVVHATRAMVHEGHVEGHVVRLSRALVHDWVLEPIPHVREVIKEVIREVPKEVVRYHDREVVKYIDRPVIKEVFREVKVEVRSPDPEEDYD